MSAATRNSLLLPSALAALGTLELVARSAVEGFFHGLHRSRRFGFSQEFAEYRAYAEGDDPRHVDWNVYARTDRTYIRRYEGETNTRLLVALDASASMGYGSGPVTKLRYAQFLAAALGYMATQQHDPVGLMVFDRQLRSWLPPSSRAGSLGALLHALDAVQPGESTDIQTALQPMAGQQGQRGLVALISDLYCDPEALTRAVRPLAQRGHDVMVFQVLDRQEMSPDWDESVMLQDLESGEQREVSPNYLAKVYPARLQAHLESLRDAVAATGAQHTLVVTDERLDTALRRYLQLRQRRG